MNLCISVVSGMVNMEYPDQPDGIDYHVKPRENIHFDLDTVNGTSPAQDVSTL